MATNDGGGSSGGGSITPSSGGSGGGSSSGGSNAVPNSLNQYNLSTEECQTLFNAEPVASLDLYLLDRCSGAGLLKIPASSMTVDGVQFAFNFDGDLLETASPSYDYYRIRNATVDISFTVRWNEILTQIKTLILPGTSGQDNGKDTHTITRRIIRRRQRQFMLLAVGEDEPANPSEANGGSFLFPNVSLDFGNGITLNFNPNDPVEAAVQLTARFTSGQDGVLAQMWDL